MMAAVVASAVEQEVELQQLALVLALVGLVSSA